LVRLVQHFRELFQLGPKAKNHWAKSWDDHEEESDGKVR
jgi:hypothetical protein